MATLERTYNVPLRKGFYKAPKYRKTKKAIIVLKEFIAKHMKCPLENVRLGKELNENIWKRGYKYPPHHVKLTAIKNDEGIVKAELFGFTYQEPIKPAEKQEKEAKKTQEKDISELKDEIDKVIDVKKVDDKPEKKEKKPRVKKAAQPKAEEKTAEDAAATSDEEAPEEKSETSEKAAEKKPRKLRAKKAAPKEDKTE